MRIVLKPGGLLIIFITLSVLGFIVFSQKKDEKAAPSSVAVVAATPAPAPVNLLRNADMTAKGEFDLPKKWGDTWSEPRPVTAKYDASESHSAPASLCLDLGKGFAKGQVKQNLDVLPGERYRVVGYIKSGGTGVWSLGTQFYDDKYNAIGFEHVGEPFPKPTWEKREKVVTIPPKVVRMGVMLYAEGEGKGWIDDVSVTREP